MGFWLEFFGLDRAKAWQQFADEIGGKFTGEGWLDEKRVEAKIGEWTVVLDTVGDTVDRIPKTFTRMRAAYRSVDGFRFKIYPENGLGFFRGLVGMKDVMVGYPAFDEAYVIEGNNTEKLRALFSSQRVREALAADRAFWMESTHVEGIGWYSEPLPKGVDELYFATEGFITDTERLKRYFDAFTEVLYQLWWIESAEKDPPKFKPR